MAKCRDDPQLRRTPQTKIRRYIILLNSIILYDTIH